MLHVMNYTTYTSPITTPRLQDNLHAIQNNITVITKPAANVMRVTVAPEKVEEGRRGTRVGGGG